MTNSAQYILQHLFGEGRLEDVSVDQLRLLVEEYPSFNAAHYLLSIKLQKEKDEDYLGVTQRTALHFHNPLWLQWLLQTTEEKPLANLEEIAAAMRASDQEYYGAVQTTESATYLGEEITREYASTTIEEPAQEIQQASVNENNFSQEIAIENPVLERYSDTTEETPQEIKNEEHETERQPQQSFQTHTEETFTETIQSTEENFDTENETSAPEEIKLEDPIFEAKSENVFDEPVQEINITEVPVFHEQIETATEEPPYTPEPAVQLESQEYHQEIVTENPVVEEIPPVEMRQEEVVYDTSIENIQTENFEEIQTSEEHVIEEPVEHVAAEPSYTELKNTEPQEEFNPEENFHETYITENPAFDENPPPAEIQNEQVAQDVHVENTQPEDFHETYITENDAFDARHGSVDPVAGRVAEVNNFIEAEQHEVNIAEQELSNLTEEKVEERHDEFLEKKEDHSPPVVLPIEVENTSIPEQVQELEETEQEHESGELELTFEPYHTIDYFASQGIKFVQEENPTDKFGKQLKTFTAWLKVMKKLPQHALLEEPDEKRNAEIEMIAADSLKEKEVDTEAMAEVLAKQGKTDKAIEMYLKLSLLNPTKIAYFAAKIEQIKRALL